MAVKPRLRQNLDGTWLCWGGRAWAFSDSMVLAYLKWTLRQAAYAQQRPVACPAPVRRLPRWLAWLCNTLPGAFLVGAGFGLLFYLCHG